MKQNFVTIMNDDGLKIDIISTGKGWIAVDKPAGISIHNDTGNDLCSLVKRSLEPLDDAMKLIDYDMSYGVNAVHRLDSETSGVVMLACNKKTAQWFSRQFEERQVKKKYIALLHGDIDTTTEHYGIWNKPLSPKSEGRKNPAGSGKKVKCRTEFRVIDKSAHYTLIECEPVTGRKHQIRRHAKLAGNPVAGDRRYGSPRALKYLEEKCSFTRLGLHSSSLGIILPGESSYTTFTSEIPSQILGLISLDQKVASI